MQPEFEDEEAIDPFDFWQGANFKLKAKNVAGYRNYDSCEFAAVSPLLDDDDALEALWKKQFSLAEIVSTDQFKTYEDLKKRLEYVLGSKRPAQAPEGFDEDDDRGEAEELVTAAVSAPQNTSTVDKDEYYALSYFAKLAEE